MSSAGPNAGTRADRGMLDPSRIKLLRHGNAQLRMTILDDRSYLWITAAQAFPLGDPQHYVGLYEYDIKDGGLGREIGLIRDVRELDHQSRALLEEELEKRYFTPLITAIRDAKSEFGTIYWDTETDKGRRQFVVRSLRESVFEISPNRYLIQDVDGNRFEIRDVNALDRRSRAKLERLL